MPISHSFTNGSIWLKISGEVSHKEVSNIIVQAMAEQRFAVGGFLVLDFQNSKTNLSTDEIQVLVSLLKGFRENFTSPILTIVSDPLHFGLMRMLQSYAENHGVEVKIFKEAKEAIKWLPIRKPEPHRPDQGLFLVTIQY